MVLPINVLRLQKRQIRLRRAQIPRELVERFAFGIVFAGDNGQMFRQRDGALFFEFDLRPESFRDERPRQPVHGQTKVVKLPQMNIRADRAAFERLQQTFGLRLDDGLMANPVQCLVLGRPHPAFLGWAILRLHERVKGGLPSAGGRPGVRAGQVGFGNLEVEDGLAQGLILGEDDLFRRVPILGLQAGPLAGHVVEAEKGSAFSAVQQTITIFHRLGGSL